MSALAARLAHGRAPPRDLAALHALLDALPPADAAARQAAARHQAGLVKPAGSLGRLEEIALHLAAWQGRARPRAERVRILVFAGSHGLTRHGVSAYPDAVNAQMLAGFRSGGAAICQLARAFAAELEAIDCGISRPTADIATAPAMTEAEFLAAVHAGMAAVKGDEDLLLFGEMGIGNSTAAAALAAALFGGPVADWIGPGTGLDGAGLTRKAAVVARALATHAAALADPLEAARRLGGRELAAMLGATLAARLCRIPVLLDGFIATAAIAPLFRLAGADAIAHLLAAHRSGEPGHARLLSALGLTPLLALDMRLGEGSGAAVALGLVRAALACHDGMASFEEAGVNGPSAAGSGTA